MREFGRKEKTRNKILPRVFPKNSSLRVFVAV